MKYIPIVILLALSPATGIAADWAEGIPVGTPFPNIEATDQNGVSWDKEKLLGEKGLVFFFNRSTDW